MPLNSSTDKKYGLSFTAASLSLASSVIIAEEYLEVEDWEKVKERVFVENLLQARTQSSLKRSYTELSKRLQTLTDEQLDLLVIGTVQEQKHVLWLAICKTYGYVCEFAVEVIREKFLSMNYKLDELDYVAFYNRRADWHEELESIAASTKYKIKQVIFRMLRQVEILTDDENIQPSILSARVKNVIQNDDPTYFYIYPIRMNSVDGVKNGGKKHDNVS